MSNFLQDLPLVVGVFVLFPPLAGWALAEVIVAALQLRALRRTGHVLDCVGLRGWPCDCRDSGPEPGRIGGREHEGAPAARVLLLPDAGPPPEGNRARLPRLRPPGRAGESPSPRY